MRRQISALVRSIPEPSAAIMRGAALGSLAYAAWWLSGAIFLIGLGPIENADYIWTCISRALIPSAIGLALLENQRLRDDNRRLTAALTEVSALVQRYRMGSRR